MLASLLGYIVLGMLLAWPLARLLRALALRSGLYQPPWQQLRPYLSPAQRSPGAPAGAPSADSATTPGAATDTPATQAGAPALSDSPPAP